MFNTILFCVLHCFGDCITFNFWDFLVGNIYKPAAGSHFVLLNLYSPPSVVNITSYDEPLNQLGCWKLFVQLWNYEANNCFGAITQFHLFILIARRQWTESRTWPIKITHSLSTNCTCLKQKVGILNFSVASIIQTLTSSVNECWVSRTRFPK